MTKPLERQQALKDSLEQRVLVLDGAMGTMIHQAPLSIETDYLGREGLLANASTDRARRVMCHHPENRSRRQAERHKRNPPRFGEAGPGLGEVLGPIPHAPG